MKFNGISRAQLVAELKAERDVLTACVSSCATVARAHFASELSHVVAFIEYLAANTQNAPQTGKCAHSKEIRRCFAIAREHGLDTRADEAMRAAIGRALGCSVETREVLNGYQWHQVGDLVKSGQLAW